MRDVVSLFKPNHLEELRDLSDLKCELYFYAKSMLLISNTLNPLRYITPWEHYYVVYHYTVVATTVILKLLFDFTQKILNIFIALHI